MLGFGAAMEAYSAALWYILHDRQEAAELRRMCNGNVVTESGYLIPYALKGIAEPSTIDDETSGDGGALGLISN
jgi:hypothetical protein